MTRKLKLILQYHGRDFVGYQRQASGISIQEAVEHALYQLTGETIAIRAAGRTDAGVHALGQVVSFHTRSTLSVHAIVHGTNAYLPETIVVSDAEEVEDSFDARRDATAKWYRYQIWNGPTRGPLLAQTHYHIRSPLDTRAMQSAAQHLCGRHDFQSFRASDCERVHTIRNIMSIRIQTFPQPYGSELFIDVEGDGFLKNMVRIIAGTLIWVGQSKLRQDQIPEILSAKDRRQAGPTAPSHGLFLCRVDYAKPKPS